ncbi:hypothetical protein AVEN_2883-1 [Araneus ventricosus]|uniref:Uncharacterized protein n=1 Tax=Araneus ventricosus TaxID=182803 RepID=A0A4Y2SAW7_ARAVE|nr:hypothetical protein AVEN_2883-1 [Araneus ventricosus]
MDNFHSSTGYQTDEIYQECPQVQELRSPGMPIPRVTQQSPTSNGDFLTKLITQLSAVPEPETVRDSSKKFLSCSPEHVFGLPFRGG